jgi:hypothetical protein
MNAVKPTPPSSAVAMTALRRENRDATTNAPVKKVAW